MTKPKRDLYDPFKERPNTVQTAIAKSMMLPVPAGRLSVIAEADRDNLFRDIGFADLLARCHDFYSISRNPKDYVLQALPIIWTELPNRNGIASPLKALTEWNKVKGCSAYQGWKGQAVRVEHDWEGPAIGIIPDVTLRRLKGYTNDTLWKLIVLHAVDRSKDPERAEKLAKGQHNSWSMGCLADRQLCSICGTDINQRCAHLQAKQMMGIWNGMLAFRVAYGIQAEESSMVDDPAYGQAIGIRTIVMDKNPNNVRSSK